MTTDTDKLDLKMIIEALLFVASEPVTVNHLASAVDCPLSVVETALEQLKDDTRRRGIRVQRQGSKVQLVSAPELTDGHFTLSWGQALGEVSFYRVKEGPDPGSLTQVYEGSNRQLPRTGLAAGQYQYQVQACNQVGDFTSCSGPRIQTGVTVAAPASAPSGLSVPAVKHQGDYSLSWGSVSNSRHYKLEERLDGGAWQTTPLQPSRAPDLRYHRFTDLQADTDYQVQLLQ